MNRTRALRCLATLVVGLLIGQADDARGSAFTVTPVRVLLGQSASSALLTVRNDSTELLRFQVSLKAWNQGENGEMQLSDTADLVFFPTIMEVKPGEERKVRIGSAFKAPVPTERSYRIFFEELPAADVARASGDEGRAAQVKVLTKMGVPIFVQPATPVLKAELTNVRVGGKSVSFDVRNMGNSFFTVTSATVTGLSKSGETTFTRQQDGWYVLAGGVRHFQFEIPEEVCARGVTDRVRVDVASSLIDERGNPIPIREETSAGKLCGSSAQVR
jgi:fimbrial chaperone protein